MNESTLARVAAASAAAFFLVVTAGRVVPEAQSEQGSGRSAISGIVVEAGTEEPVAGAVVSLSGTGYKGAAFVTDKRGRFVFERLPPGHYTIAAQKLGYFDGLFGETAIPDDPFSVRLGLEGVRRLILGEQHWYQDAVVRLKRPASIAGYVFDEHQRPIASRTVRVLAVDPAGAQAPFLAGASVTDDRGAFTVDRLSQGTYVVAVLAVEPDGSPAVTPNGLLYPLTYYPDGLALQEATPLAIGFGDDVQGIVVNLAPVATRRVAGRLIGHHPLPPALQVALAPAGDSVSATTSQVRRVTASAQGTFQFDAVPAGDYTVAIVEPAIDPPPPLQLSGGPLPWSIPGGATSRGTLTVWGHTTVSVRDTDARDVVIQVRPGAALSGRVIVHGLVQTQVEFPGTVSLLPMGKSSRTTRTSPIASDGSFTLEGLVPDDYLVRLAGVIHEVTIGGSLLPGPIRITGQTESIALEITTGPGAKLTGVVSPLPSLSHEPLSVIYFPDERFRWEEPSSPPSRAGRLAVRSDGTFESRGSLPPGRYRVVAVADSIAANWQSAAFRDVALGSAATVDVSAGRTVHVNLEPSQVTVR